MPRPPTWKVGRTQHQTSRAVESRWRLTAAADARIARLDNATSFKEPVVPEVESQTCARNGGAAACICSSRARSSGGRRGLSSRWVSSLSKFNMDRCRNDENQECRRRGFHAVVEFLRLIAQTDDTASGRNEHADECAVDAHVRHAPAVPVRAPAGKPFVARHEKVPSAADDVELRFIRSVVHETHFTTLRVIWNRAGEARDFVGDMVDE